MSRLLSSPSRPSNWCSFCRPVPFDENPTVIVARPYSYDVAAHDVDVVCRYLQGSFARTRLFRVIPHLMMENRFLEKQVDPDFRSKNRSFDEYPGLASWSCSGSPSARSSRPPTRRASRFTLSVDLKVHTRGHGRLR